MSVSVTLKLATDADANVVTDILVSSRSAFLPYAPSIHTPEEILEWVAEHLMPTGHVAIAKHNNTNVAVMATSISNGTGWIDQLYVAPEYVGQGTGSILLNHAIEQLPRPIHLWTFQKNHGAKRFYERHGFVAIQYTNGENNEERCPDVMYEYNSP